MRILDDERLTPRKRKILRAIVDAHISHGEPVGSKFLANDVQISCSPATIRNEMADLEEMGYLIQPHTSAGRVPSERGYRFYVDSLVEQYGNTRREIGEMSEKLRYKLTEMDEILSEVSRLATAFTDYTGIAFKAGSGNVRLSKVEAVYISPREFLLVMMFASGIVKTKTVCLSFSLLPDDLKRFTEVANIYLVNLTSDGLSMSVISKLEQLMGSASAMVHPVIKLIYETMNEIDTADIHVDGVNKLLRYPEYSDVTRLRELLEIIEEKDPLLNLIAAHAKEGEGNIHVVIGAENESDAMSDTTLIYRDVRVGGKKISVGVIGPKRMNYSKAIDTINRLAAGIEQVFGASDERGLPPPRNDTNQNGKDI